MRGDFSRHLRDRYGDVRIHPGRLPAENHRGLEQTTFHHAGCWTSTPTTFGTVRHGAPSRAGQDRRGPWPGPIFWWSPAPPVTNDTLGDFCDRKAGRLLRHDVAGTAALLGP
jgi:hypothetical protein